MHFNSSFKKTKENLWCVLQTWRGSIVYKLWTWGAFQWIILSFAGRACLGDWVFQFPQNCNVSRMLDLRAQTRGVHANRDDWSVRMDRAPQKNNAWCVTWGTGAWHLITSLGFIAPSPSLQKHCSSTSWHLKKDLKFYFKFHNEINAIKKEFLWHLMLLCS